MINTKKITLSLVTITAAILLHPIGDALRLSGYLRYR